MTIDDQIRLVLGAQELAGLTGSALHLLLFHEGVKATYLVRTPSVNLNFPMIDALTRSSGRYITVVRPETVRLGKEAFGLATPAFLEPNLVLDGLGACGFDCRGISVPPREAAERAFLDLYHRNRADLLRQRRKQEEALLADLIAFALSSAPIEMRDRLAAALEAAGLDAEAAVLKNCAERGDCHPDDFTSPSS